MRANAPRKEPEKCHGVNYINTVAKQNVPFRVIKPC